MDIKVEIDRDLISLLSKGSRPAFIAEQVSTFIKTHLGDKDEIPDSLVIHVELIEPVIPV